IPRTDPKRRRTAIDATALVPHLRRAIMRTWILQETHDDERHPGVAGPPGWPVALSGRLAAGGRVPPDPAVDPGRRHARGCGLRPLEYRAQHPPAVRATVESRLRCRQRPMALLPARRRDRGPDLADLPAVQHAARAIIRARLHAGSFHRLWRRVWVRRPVQYL